MGNHLVAHPSYDFFIACTEVNEYLEMKNSLTWIIVLWIYIFLYKALINNSYMIYNTYGSPSNDRKRKISQILYTALTHATDYIKK